MATNCARFIACQLRELSQIRTEEGRPFRVVLARERIWLGPICRAPHELSVRDPSLERSGGSGDYRRPPLRMSGFGADSGPKPHCLNTSVLASVIEPSGGQRRHPCWWSRRCLARPSLHRTNYGHDVARTGPGIRNDGDCSLPGRAPGTRTWSISARPVTGGSNPLLFAVVMTARRGIRRPEVATPSNTSPSEEKDQEHAMAAASRRRCVFRAIPKPTAAASTV
jgi:hypothetical protein